MVSYNTDLRSWGATGTEPPTDYSYIKDEPPVDEYDNWVNDNVIEDLLHLTDLTNARIESEKGASGSEPTSPEASHLYHDQDNERLKVWDTASSAWRGLLYRDGDTLNGALNMGDYALNGVGDINDKSGNTIWDTSAGYIPQERLQNDSVTVAGNNVSLGESISINLNDISNVTATGEGSGNSFDADTVDGKHADDVGIEIEDNGTVITSPSTAIDFTGYLNVTDDGDGTVTVDSSHNHDGRYFTETELTTGALSHGDLSNISSSSHHTRYSDSEASNAAPVQSVNSLTGDVSIKEGKTEKEVRDDVLIFTDNFVPSFLE